MLELVLEKDQPTNCQIEEEPGAQDTSNPLNMFSTMGWKFVLAAKVLEASRAVQIYHGSGAE